LLGLSIQVPLLGRLLLALAIQVLLALLLRRRLTLSGLFLGLPIQFSLLGHLLLVLLIQILLALPLGLRSCLPLGRLLLSSLLLVLLIQILLALALGLRGCLPLGRLLLINLLLVLLVELLLSLPLLRSGLPSGRLVGGLLLTMLIGVVLRRLRLGFFGRLLCCQQFLFLDLLFGLVLLGTIRLVRVFLLVLVLRLRLLRAGCRPHRQRQQRGQCNCQHRLIQIA